MTFHLMGALAEFDALSSSNAHELALKPRRRGVRVGRSSALPAAQVKHALKLIDSGERPSAVAGSLGVNRSTLFRALSKHAVA